MILPDLLQICALHSVLDVCATVDVLALVVEAMAVLANMNGRLFNYECK